MGMPIMSLLLHTIKWGGENFYVYVWAVMFAVQLIMMSVYPTFIQPCFNKVEPLQAGSLRTKIEELAKSVNFPLTKLYVIDGSKRSGHSNAYFYGFFKNKRIVLYDTLISQCTEDEVVSILGHELGHWKLNHTVQGLLIAQVHIIFTFFMFSRVYGNAKLFSDFGFTSQPTLIGLLLFMYIFSPVDQLVSFFMNVLSRHNEFAADNFAVKLGHGANLGKGLVKIQKENLGTMISDPWYSTFHHSHPPVQERLKTILTAVSKTQ
jgi:STE24 endopeptidase